MVNFYEFVRFRLLNACGIGDLSYGSGPIRLDKVMREGIAAYNSGTHSYD